MKRFNKKELQRQWEKYGDYLESHSGQAYRCMSFDEWRLRGK